MAITLTEKFKVDVAGGVMMKVFTAEGCVNSAEVITPASLGMNRILVAVPTYMSCTLTGTTTSYPNPRTLGMSSDGTENYIKLSNSETGNSYLLQVWGY